MTGLLFNDTCHSNDVDSSLLKSRSAILPVHREGKYRLTGGSLYKLTSLSSIQSRHELISKVKLNWSTSIQILVISVENYSNMLKEAKSIGFNKNLFSSRGLKRRQRTARQVISVKTRQTLQIFFRHPCLT